MIDMTKELQIIEAIRTLVRAEQPNQDISQLLLRHNCFYLLSKIKAINPYTQEYKQLHLLNSISIRQRFKSCAMLFRELNALDIPYAVIKGAVLSQMAYGSPNHRRCGDIDLLISRSYISPVKKLMKSHGFVQGRVTEKGVEPFSREEILFQTSMSHQVAPFIKETGASLCPYVNVDVNFNIMWGESEKKADMDFVLKHTEPFSICSVMVRKLTPEAEFISLCLHHYKDMNSIYLLAQGSLRLSLFCDIYYYVKNTQMDAEKLKTLCSQLEVTPYVYYCLHYTDVIFNDGVIRELFSKLLSVTNPSLPPVASASTKAQYKVLLNQFGLTPSERQTWTIDFYERLFSSNLQTYFEEHLSHKLLNKIALNREFM